LRAVFAGGGTAGHIFPGIAAGQKIMEKLPGSEILFFTLESAMGFEPLCSSGFRIEPVAAGAFAGKGPGGKMFSLYNLLKGFLRAIIKVKKFNPDVIIGTGGYAAAPVVLAGAVLKKKIVLLEQNFVPGLATRFLAFFAAEVELSFPGSEVFLSRKCRYTVTGNPVRNEIILSGRVESMAALGISLNKNVLAVIGGSSGARSLNFAMERFVAWAKKETAVLFKKWQLIHMTGEKDCEHMRSVYLKYGIDARVYPFLEHIGRVYACAGLIFARSGGNTVAEAASRSVPAVYAPYPFATDNHQHLNARYYCDRGAAVMVEDADLCSEKFFRLLADVMQDDDKRRRMSFAAGGCVIESPGEKVFNRILSITGGGACSEK
jgi:UDP-N-acetylglucosamine--N-acetylmuramyl-(pentapeptide) pyrophosphoryl-undecaprenol N-acetylglucosamine transferase